MFPDDPVFIVDLNEIEGDGDTINVSEEYTLQFGPRRKYRGASALRIKPGDDVRIESDEDRTLYWATVIEVLGGGEYRVRIDWTSVAPILNELWAAPCDSDARRLQIVTSPAQ